MNCGAPIQVDSDSKTGKCEFCGSEYTTQDVINNYQINNNYNTVQYVTKNINGNSALEAEEYIKNGDIFISLNDFKKANEAYSKAIELNPADCFAWFGLVKVATRNFTDFEDITHYGYYAKAKKVASRKQEEKIDEIYLPYQTKRKNLEIKKRQESELHEYERQRLYIKLWSGFGFALCFVVLIISITAKIWPLCVVAGIATVLLIYFVFARKKKQ